MGWCRLVGWRDCAGCCCVAIAGCLGSGCGLNFGRQAAWRPGVIGMVSSGLWAALQAVAVFSDCEVVGLRGSNSVVKLLGGWV